MKWYFLWKFDSTENCLEFDSLGKVEKDIFGFLNQLNKRFLPMNMVGICQTFKYVPVAQSNSKKIELLLCAWSKRETCVFENTKCKLLFESKHYLWKKFLYQIL